MSLSWTRPNGYGLPASLYLVPERKVARGRHVPVGRTLHLVDLENLMRGPFNSRAALRRASDEYRHAAPVDGDDHVIVATNPALTVEASLAWPQARLLIGYGTNGADLALIQQIADLRWVGARFDRLVIGSGDGIFVSAVLAVREMGIPVGVVAPEHGVSLRLARSATFVRLMPEQVDSEVVA